ncbi:DUF3624 domain-containing protein [Photobacterium ganghwense]|uniref:DUF3624 domain-containing protein n=1 Tax=Photobacterium ganghwense TaxID=320778 RepID=UPI0039EF30D3
MACQPCRSSVFFQKLGRCRRCMVQLSVLAPLSWLAWWLLYRETPHTLNAITLLVAASGFSLLLLAHGVRARQLHRAASRHAASPRTPPTPRPDNGHP